LGIDSSLNLHRLIIKIFNPHYYLGCDRLFSGKNAQRKGKTCREKPFNLAFRFKYLVGISFAFQKLNNPLQSPSGDNILLDQTKPGNTI